MNLLKKNRQIFWQLLLFCGILVLLRIVAKQLWGMWGFFANLTITVIWWFLVGLAFVFLALQIIQNFRFERSFIPAKMKLKSLPSLKNYRILNSLSDTGIFYKAQLHTHSNLSYDSKVAPLQIINSYKEDGYSILAITDHDVLSDFSSLSTDDMLILPGIEETIPVLFWPIPLGKHLLLINPEEKRPHCKNLQERLHQAANSEGLAIPAHLGWRGGAGTGRWYPHELAQLQNLQLIEIENPHSKDPMDMTIWHQLLIRSGAGKPIWGIAVDDSHSGSSNSGWIMVKAPRLDLTSVITSIKKGAFYATNGPSILDIKVEDSKIYVSSPDAVWIRFINSQNQVVSAVRAKEAIYNSYGDEGFIRIEVTDLKGRKAWSQPMWLVPKE